MNDDEILNPVLGDGATPTRCRCSAACRSGTPTRRSSQTLRAPGPLHDVQDSHSYMHCWRHKIAGDLPRATSGSPRMDGATRETGGSAAGESATRCASPRWRRSSDRLLPRLGQGAAARMIANRPDWTLSRQRQWGVPLAFFVHKRDRRAAPAHARAARARRAARRARRHRGLAAAAPRRLLGEEADQYEKNHDTLDVWFDSGSTHHTVLRGSHAAQSTFPADLYLEGSDQHRGWFHSSLLTSARRSTAWRPYKALLTHGFVVDGAGPQDEQVAGQHASCRQKVRTRWAPRSCGYGSRRPTTRASCRCPTRSSSAWSSPTGASATRCASCWPT